MAYIEPKKQREYQRLWRRNKVKQEREKCYSILGGKCVRCGISDFRVLQIDHKNPVKRKSDIIRFETGTRLRQIIANGSRKIKDLQLLCANCHQIKTHWDCEKLDSRKD